jgi:hypothetical protein
MVLYKVSIKNRNLVKDIPIYSLSSLVSEKIFEISAYQSILLALAAMVFSSETSKSI